MFLTSETVFDLLHLFEHTALEHPFVPLLLLTETCRLTPPGQDDFRHKYICSTC
ncbi:hypothetical protein AALP_AA8G382400 [Arabis alpina]|uniref:Uncharacterized protein n=1 Tax=Arabis alpina TaxID=50452 RepID=A0A087GC37_ARAAL|nr:hypothetical protein AALP_AA8G382400 [Arabis alpina]